MKDKLIETQLVDAKQQTAIAVGKYDAQNVREVQKEIARLGVEESRINSLN